MILDANLAVMIDIHPDSDFKEKLAKEGDFTEQFADFWRGLARHYSNLDPNLVFFEILNEPEARDPYRWYGVESRWPWRFARALPITLLLLPARGTRTMMIFCPSSRCTIRT
jgi:endoglucanase